MHLDAGTTLLCISMHVQGFRGIDKDMEILLLKLYEVFFVWTTWPPQYLVNMPCGAPIPASTHSIVWSPHQDGSMTYAHKTNAHKTNAHKTNAHKTYAHNTNGKRDICSQLFL